MAYTTEIVHLATRLFFTKRGNKHVKALLKEATLFLPVETGWKERCWYIINGITAPILCEYCNVNKATFNKEQAIPRRFCSSLCSSKSPSVKEKREQTNIQLYGKSCSDMMKTASEAFREKYGVANPSHVKEFNDIKAKKFIEKNEEEKQDIKQKRQQTNLAKYGTVNPSSNDNIKKKRTQTVQRLYNVDNVFQDPDVKRKIRHFYHTTRGVKWVSQSHFSEETYALLNDRTFLEHQHVLLQKPLNQIAEEIGVGHKTIHNYMVKHNLPVYRWFVSKFEHEVRHFLMSELGYGESDLVCNSKPIGQFELDIFIPSSNVAIECNGMYWHTEESGNRGRLYHLSKTEMCEQHNIQLFHIFETEWNSKREIWESILRSGTNRNEEVVGARECRVDEISIEEANSFCSNNHLQGGHLSATKKAKAYVLTKDNEIQGCCIFDASRFSRHHEWELIRMCFKKGVTVRGGVSRLITKFERENRPKSLLSYADRRYSRGKGYEATGFNHVGVTSPSYFYFKHSRLFNRINFQKHKLSKKLKIYDESLSEWENMKANGYDRIWDCGHIKWEKKYD